MKHDTRTEARLCWTEYETHEINGLPCRAGAALAPRVAPCWRWRGPSRGEAAPGDWALPTQLDGRDRRLGPEAPRAIRTREAAPIARSQSK
jgi:hypothetical protein